MPLEMLINGKEIGTKVKIEVCLGGGCCIFLKFSVKISPNLKVSIPKCAPPYSHDIQNTNLGCELCCWNRGVK